MVASLELCNVHGSLLHKIATIMHDIIGITLANILGNRNHACLLSGSNIKLYTKQTHHYNTVRKTYNTATQNLLDK